MAFAVSRSIKLAVVSMVMLVLFGLGYNFEAAGGQLPLGLDWVLLLCMSWPLVLVAAVVQRLRENRERR